MSKRTPEFIEHRWSGWPGAWCLDCGAEDPREWCIVTHEDGCKRPECQPTSCPEPGSKSRDPYARSEPQP